MGDWCNDGFSSVVFVGRQSRAQVKTCPMVTHLRPDLRPGDQELAMPRKGQSGAVDFRTNVDGNQTNSWQEMERFLLKMSPLSSRQNRPLAASNEIPEIALPGPTQPQYHPSESLSQGT